MRYLLVLILITTCTVCYGEDYTDILDSVDERIRQREEEQYREEQLDAAYRQAESQERRESYDRINPGYHDLGEAD